MKKEEILNKLKEILKEQFGDEIPEIQENTDILEDLKADSLAMVELIMNIEDEFEISIANEDAMKFKKIGDVVEYIIANKK